MIGKNNVTAKVLRMSTQDCYDSIKSFLEQSGQEISARDEPVREITNVSIVNTTPERNEVDVEYFCKEYCDREFNNILAGRDCDMEHPDVVKEKLNPDGTVKNLFWGPEVREGMQEDSIQRVIEELKRDENSRRGIIDLNTRNPKTRKDFPCLAFCHFIIRNKKLNMQLHSRSTDVDFGFVNDAYLFQKFQKYVADKLGITMGYFIYRTISLHEYLEE